MAGDRTPMTWSTNSALIVARSRQDTTESWTTPVPCPSGVLASMNRQAGSVAMLRFFVTSATTRVRRA